ncbi:hypothetical protein Aperf_G00000127957 [Anoplocephala perfoliata]
MLFSNLSLPTSDDFRETKYLMSSSSVSKPNRDSYVHLEEARTGLFIAGIPNDVSQNHYTLGVSQGVSQPPVLFHANSVARVEQNGSVTVLAGPRLTLQRRQRHRLTRCIGKALYGKRFNQNFQPFRRRNRTESPIGMRLQRFAFAASGQETAKYASWPLTLSMYVEENQSLASGGINQPITGIRYWGLFLINWMSSLYEL